MRLPFASSQLQLLQQLGNDSARLCSSNSSCIRNVHAALCQKWLYSSQADTSKPYDVVIVGAGMVGAAVAALLRNQRLTSTTRIALLDTKAQSFEYPFPKVPRLRVSTITPASIACLQQAGVWPALQPPRSAAFTHMQVWDTASPGHIHWSASDVGAQHMGVVVENDALQAALLASARSGLGGSSMPPVQPAATTSTSPPATPDPSLLSSSPSPSPSSLSPLPSSPSAAAAGAGANASAGTEGSGDGASQAPGCMSFLWPAEIVSLRLPPLTTTSSASAAPEAGGSSSGSSSGSGSHGLAEVGLSDGSVLRARLVVAADGAASRVRELAGLRAPPHSYAQRGVVATVEFADGNGNSGSAGSGRATAWQRFLPTGPLALLPLRDGYASIVWSTTPAMAAALEKMGPEEFGEAVNQALRQPSSLPSTLEAAAAPLSQLAGALSGALGSLAGPPLALPPLVARWAGYAPRSFPLQTRHAGSYVLPRLALVGDAAHAVHPLAGQGVNLGLGDALVLAQALAAAREVGGDVGDLRMLREDYEVPRRRTNTAMMTALDAVRAAFVPQGSAHSGGGSRAAAAAADAWPLLRGVGLSALNAAGPLKNHIMRFAMGVV